MKMNSKNLLYIMPLSNVAFGAEEKDLHSGIELLQSIHNLNVFVIKIDLKQKTIHTKINRQKLVYRLNWKDRVKFIFIKLGALDNAMRQAFTYGNYKLVIQIIKFLEIDIVFTNTTSTVLFGRQTYAKHVFRSVSFEPIYVLKAVDNMFTALIHSLTKIISIHNELSANLILSISPRDAKYYRIVSSRKNKHKITVLPLRQFYLHKKVDKVNRIKSTLEIGFLGSTYNVLHNRKSYEFILNSISSEFLSMHNVNLNIYGRKIPEFNRIFHNIKIHNWVESIEQIYEKNDCFLVPYFLGSGMQSKVFEPLLAGKLLICDPRVLSGYSFKPYEHFVPAKNPDDFLNAILWIKNNDLNANQIRRAAAEESFRLIGPNVIYKQINESI
jgi:glycosyltransferase involved in cell wall biosynthesis